MGDVIVAAEGALDEAGDGVGGPARDPMVGWDGKGSSGRLSCRSEGPVSITSG
jgi:hypothetical protein